MKKFMASLLLTALIVLTNSFDSLVDHRVIQALPNPTGFRFSPTDHLIGITNYTSFIISQAVTGKSLARFENSGFQGNYISTYEFSDNGNWFGVGYNNTEHGVISIFTNISNLEESKEVGQTLRLIESEEIDNNETKDVRGVDFIGDKYFVRTQSFGRISITNMSRDQSPVPNYFNFEQYDFGCVEVTDHHNNIFIVVARNTSSNQLQFLYFQYLTSSKELNIIDNSIKLPEEFTYVTDIRSSFQKNLLFIVGNPTDIYYFDFRDKIVKVYPSPAQSSTGYKSIQFSWDRKIFMVTNETHFQYMVFKDETNQVDLIVKEIAKPAAALAFYSGNVFYINMKQETITSGVCKEGQYLNDETLECVLCENNCSLCARTTENQQCLQCQKGLYIQNNSCQACREHCASCISYDYCQYCNDTFVFNGSICQCNYGSYEKGDVCVKCKKGCIECTSENECQRCDSGYFQDGETCSMCADNCIQCLDLQRCQSCSEQFLLVDGKCQKEESSPLSGWIIALIVIIVVLLIGGGALVGYRKYMKNHRTDNPILSDKLSQQLE